VRQSKPAVVYLKGLDKAGSGFFVTGTGVIVTNAHLARGEETLLTLLSSGEQLEAKVVHVDPDLDIALAKVDLVSAKREFPHLTLADASTVHQGENVLAIGNPGDAMLFSVTKGIVSAVGEFPSAGPAPGFRRTLLSIPATAADRCSTPAAKSSASTRKNSSRKMSPASASP
jgi:S1-C subfamily serine protease